MCFEQSIMQATQNIFTSINGEGPCPSSSLRFKQPRTPTEKAVAALAERLVSQFDRFAMGALFGEHRVEPQIGAPAMAAEAMEELDHILQPAARSAAAGSVHNARYSQAERWHGLQVASSVISLDSKNVSAWSMAYQLLPDDSSTVRLVAGGEMRQLNRQQVDHAMIDIINGRG